MRFAIVMLLTLAYSRAVSLFSQDVSRFLLKYVETCSADPASSR